jgi:AcrR family transcriptional regulator
LEDNELKERILNKAQEVFFQYGYTRVKMDEIADALGISKKTLYKFFEGKENLLREIIERIKLNIRTNCDVICENSNMEFIQKLKTLMDYIAKTSSLLRGPLPEDIQKNHPEIWRDVNEHRKKESLAKFAGLINEGVTSGDFRKDIDQQVIVLAYVNAVSSLINPELLMQLPYTGHQVFEMLIKIIFEGILTDEGRQKYLSSHTTDNNENGVKL